MSQTGLSTFDSTLHVTNTWLNDVMDLIGSSDRHFAFQALRAVLHAIRDRLSVDEAAAFGAQLPLLVRGVYYEGWHPAGKPIRERRREEFLAYLAAAFHDDPDIDLESVAQAVFQVIERHVSSGELEHVLHAMPKDIRTLLSEQSHTLWT